MQRTPNAECEKCEHYQYCHEKVPLIGKLCSLIQSYINHPQDRQAANIICSPCNPLKGKSTCEYCRIRPECNHKAKKLKRYKPTQIVAFNTEGRYTSRPHEYTALKWACFPIKELVNRTIKHRHKYELIEFEDRTEYRPSHHYQSYDIKIVNKYRDNSEIIWRDILFPDINEPILNISWLYNDSENKYFRQGIQFYSLKRGFFHIKLSTPPVQFKDKDVADIWQSDVTGRVLYKKQYDNSPQANDRVGRKISAHGQYNPRHSDGVKRQVSVPVISCGQTLSRQEWRWMYIRYTRIHRIVKTKKQAKIVYRLLYSDLRRIDITRELNTSRGYITDTANELIEKARKMFAGTKQVEIFEKKMEGGYSFSQLSELFGVSKPRIPNAIRRVLIKLASNS